jgi:voltage-gated potassium channel
MERRTLARSQVAYDRFAKAVDGPMMVITIFWIPVLIIPLVTPVHGGLDESLVAIDYTIWALFVIEYFVKFYLAPERWRYFKTHILDFIIVIVPFFRPLRVARLVRLQVLLRVSVLGGEAVRRARQVLTHKGFHFVVLFAAILIFLCAGLVTVAEKHAHGASIHNYGQGLWWAIATVTTVGYGDRVPVSPMGQGVAVILMLVGIGLIGALTATVASYFMEQKSDETELRLQRIESLLEQLVLQVPNTPLGALDAAAAPVMSSGGVSAPVDIGDIVS